MGVPAPANSPCVACEKIEPIMHSHHTVPRSRGGEDSLQIPLCPTCHNSLHAHALFSVSQIRTNKIRKPKQFWPRPEQEVRVRPYLEILVKALLLPIPPGVERQHQVATSVSTVTFEGLKLLQLDLGLSSLQKTLDYCIQSALTSKGLSNVSRKTKQNSSAMWFLQQSGKR